LHAKTLAQSTGQSEDFFPALAAIAHQSLSTLRAFSTRLARRSISAKPGHQCLSARRASQNART
jgi:hypothetical protein